MAHRITGSIDVRRAPGACGRASRRLGPSLGLTVAALLALATGRAEAIELAVIGSDAISVAAGEPFVIDLAVDNATRTASLSLEVWLAGLAHAGARVTGGRSAASYFDQVCTTSRCFGGLMTLDDLFFDSSDLSAGAAYTPGDDDVLVISAISLPTQPTDAPGDLDPGLDGQPGMPSARDATIELVASTVGVHVLHFGGEFALAGVECPCERPLAGAPSLTVTVVPEPSSAVLLSIGLAVLAGRRERRTSLSIPS